MQYYGKELEALKRSGRYRERHLFDETLVDLASNDYLGLAEEASIFHETVARLRESACFGAKASMLVNGYHPIHQQFEAALCEANDFEAGVVVGSGFSANIAMIEALVRRGDALFIDEKYHASGILATKLISGTMTRFPHNDVETLETMLQEPTTGRKIIAIEGIYSMDGDLCDRRIFDLAKKYDAILIVDEAHSSGVIGERLMGVFDHYGITPQANHIKMGTLGKAYGGFGAYILASEHLIDYLLNRAKPLIYATAPSLFETAHAHTALEYIQSHVEGLKTAIRRRQGWIAEVLEGTVPGLIVPIPMGDNREVLAMQQRLLAEGILVGAIRQPTVDRAIIRLIARVNVDEEALAKAFQMIGSGR